MFTVQATSRGQCAKSPDLNRTCSLLWSVSWLGDTVRARGDHSDTIRSKIVSGADRDKHGDGEGAGWMWGRTDSTDRSVYTFLNKFTIVSYFVSR